MSTLSRPTLGLEHADQIARAAEDHANVQGWAVAICVTDAFGAPLVVRRMDAAWPATVEIAIGKARSTIRFGRPSGALEDMINGGRTAFLGVDDVTPLRGGLPIKDGDTVVGAIGISGLTPDKDEAVAQAGIDGR